MPVAPTHLKRLQNEPSHIRNICILAHVDHGKTSLSDCLLASNGIISQKLAGKVRYLDSRPDEQQRGITMESSAISLYFRVLTKVADQEEPLAEEHLINLIDSPGHIDFSSEVSTASRLCDGAVVLVDAVEGVCSQTVTVLRQTWIENLRPMIVINKIDRLIVELQLTPLEAYNHLNKLIEQVNVVMSSFFTGQRMADDLKWRERMGDNEDAENNNNDSEEFVESSDADIYFSPEKMNVIFASAIDGWGFNISQFAAIYERKLGMKRENLEKVLWGDFFLDPKTKKIIPSKGLKGRNLKPLFVTLILENIWAIYESTVINRNPEKSEKIIKALGLKISPREISSKDGKSLLNSMLGQWIPLSSAVLLTVIKQLPSPLVAQTSRIASILDTAPGGDQVDPVLRQAMIECDRTGPVSAYISKVISVPENELPRNKRADISMEELRERGRQAREAAVAAAEAAEKKQTADEDNQDDDEDEYEDYDFTKTTETAAPEVKEVMIGFGRVYSGTLRVGQDLLILGPKYHPSHPKAFVSRVTITDLYLLMGRELVALDEAPAGNIVGIGGLEGKILKNATLVSLDHLGANLAGINLSAPPIVRVALEPTNPTQLDQLELGLKLLNQSDPCVKILVQETGEHVMITAGELHLERCLKDLRERFAKIEIQASKPIVPYRETIVAHPDNFTAVMKNPELGRGVVEIEIGQVKLRLRMTPLPSKVTTFLHEHKLSIASIVNAKKRGDDVDADVEVETEVEVDADITDDVEFNEATKLLKIDEFTTQLNDIFTKASQKDELNRSLWKSATGRIAAFGPRRVGPNLLLDGSDGSILKRLLNGNNADRAFEFEDSITTGFQLAMAHGPLCAEQVEGVACIIESVTIDADIERMAGISGRLITATRDALHQCFLDWSPRLMLAMYVCDIQATTEVLGKVYAVVTKRRGRIVSEEMKEGTPFFFIKALMPVVEAFGFADDIRKKTSGAASPQLIFSGFQILDEDPFWVPTTEEELEDLGDIADRENIAKKYIDAIRTRKGLFVEKKLVDNAERQRTLKK